MGLFLIRLLCIYIILDKGYHVLYVFGLNSMVCSHIVGVHFCLGTRSLITLSSTVTCIIIFHCVCASKISSNFHCVLVYDIIFQFNLVCLLSLIYLCYSIFDIAMFIHLQHLRHTVQYICTIVFKRIFWNYLMTVTVTLNMHICLQGGGV